MLRSALIAFFRSFTRHPLYALLTLLGLSFGIAAFITLSLLYHFETDYERWSPERPRIYAMATRVHMPGIADDLVPQTMGDLLPEIRTEWPAMDGTRDFGDWFIVHRGRDVFAEHMEFVDANFLTFFGVPVLRGDPATALADPSRVVVSAQIARKYFGTIDVVGRTLLLSTEDGLKTYAVSAVIADLPKSSDMRLDMLRLISPDIETRFAADWHSWGLVGVKTYLKFDSAAKAHAFAGQLPAFVDRRAGPTFGNRLAPSKILELKPVPLADAHLINPKLKAAIASLGLVGVLALGLALINYVNLATARAGLRAREVAVRKTLGAPPRDLRGQFLIEAVLILLLAFLVASSVVELGLPLINAAGGLSLMLDYRADAIWMLGLLGCVVAAGLVAALYPAFVLAAFRPAQVLASSRTPGGGRAAGWLRTGLAVVQFTVVVVTFILMAGFMLQIRHIQTADLGFQRNNLLFIGGMADPLVTPAQREAFMTAARRLPAVRYVSIATTEPGSGMDAGYFAQIVRPGQSDDLVRAPKINYVVVGQDYFPALGARLLAGRLFDPRHAEDQLGYAPPDGNDRAANIIISRRTVRDMGFPSPQAAVGARARLAQMPVRIIGVVDDVRFESPTQAIPGRAYAFDAHGGYGLGQVRYQGESEAAMRADLTQVWRQIIPDVPLAADSATGQLDTYYKPERDRSHLFDIGAGVAALIGCIGLYGMAAFNSGRRVREIGMRKVLGASRGQMVRLMLVSFLRPVVAASLVAWPLAWIFLQRWLGQFDDAIAMPLWVFPLASVVALLIALATVAGVAFTTAGIEPGKALRHQ